MPFTFFKQVRNNPFGVAYVCNEVWLLAQCWLAASSSSSASRFLTSVSTQAPLLTKSPQLLFIRNRRHIDRLGTLTHTHTPSLECSFVQFEINKRERKLPEVCCRFGHAHPDGGGGRIKVLSCKIKIQPSSSVRPQGMVRIEQHRRCEMEFASVRTDPCVRECVTADESK